MIYYNADPFWLDANGKTAIKLTTDKICQFIIKRASEVILLVKNSFEICLAFKTKKIMEWYERRNCEYVLNNIQIIYKNCIQFFKFKRKINYWNYWNYIRDFFIFIIMSANLHLYNTLSIMFTDSDELDNLKEAFLPIWLKLGIIASIILICYYLYVTKKGKLNLHYQKTDFNISLI